MMVIAIDAWRDEDGRHSVTRACLRCDDCGADGRPDYLEHEHDEWGKALLRAGAPSAGWTTYLVGKVQRDRCATCTRRLVDAARPAGTQLEIGGLRA